MSKTYQRKKPRVIKYQIRQLEIGRMHKVWSSPMWQVAASPIEAVVLRFPGMRVARHHIEPTHYTVRPMSGKDFTILVECKPATL